MGPLSGAQAIHADRGELGAMDAGSQPILPPRSLKPKREELNAAIERARLVRWRTWEAFQDEAA